MLSCAASAVRSGRSTLVRDVGLRGMATGQDLKLPALPYDYDALAPVIIPEIMEIHHTKHHQAYVTGFNNALTQLKDAEAKTDPSAIVGLQSALKFNGGGHINHAIFWKSLIPPKAWPAPGREFQPPSGPLEEQIKATWGSLDTFTAKFNAAAAGVQGSGWGWLAYNPETKGLQIATTANQDPLQPTTKLIPLLGVDVWEHAYYLQYKNVRPDYLKEIWKVINWKEAGDRFAAASKA